MSKSNKCYEIGQNLGTVSGVVFESLGIYLATKNVAENQLPLPAPNALNPPGIKNGMLIYGVLSALGKVTKSAIDYGFEYLCNNDQDDSSKSIIQDHNLSSDNNSLVNELQAPNDNNNV